MVDIWTVNKGKMSMSGIEGSGSGFCLRLPILLTFIGIDLLYVMLVRCVQFCNDLLNISVDQKYQVRHLSIFKPETCVLLWYWWWCRNCE
jgi:hypothetical protein